MQTTFVINWNVNFKFCSFGAVCPLSYCGSDVLKCTAYCIVSYCITVHHYILYHDPHIVTSHEVLASTLIYDPLPVCSLNAGLED